MLSDSLSELWELIIRQVGVDALLGVAPSVLFWRVHKFLSDKEHGTANRVRLKELLIEPRWLEQYRALLTELQNVLHRVYGEGYSWQAFRVSWMIAVWYPFPLASVSRLKIDATSNAKLALGVGVVAVSVPLGLLTNSFSLWLRKRYEQLRVVRWIRNQPAGISTALEFGGAFVVVAIAIARTSDPLLNLTTSRSFTNAIPVAGAAIVTVAVAVAGSGALVGTAAATFASATIIFLGLPGVNALFDWVSWKVSRHFIDLARRSRPWWHSLRDLAFDCTAATLFMVAMALTLPALIESANAISPLFGSADPPTDWQEAATQALNAPWGEGIWVTLMLVTTLLPTTLHIACGTLSLALHALPGQAFAHYIDRMNDRDRPTFGNRLDPLLATTWLMAYISAGLLPLLGLAKLVQWAFGWMGPHLHSIALSISHPAWGLLLIALVILGRKRFGAQPPAPRPEGIAISNPSRLLPSTTRAQPLDLPSISEETPRSAPD